MANEQNLIPLNKRSKSAQRAIQEKGRAANKARCERERQIKETLLAILSLPSQAVTGEEVVDDSGCQATAMYAGCLATVKKWLETGDVGALEKIMNAIGQKPADKVESNETVRVTYQWRE